MKTRKVFLLFLFVTAYLLSLQSYAQVSRKTVKKNNKNMSKFRGQKNTFTKQKQYMYAGLSVDALNYFGDIVPKSNFASTKISFTRPGVSGHFGYRIGPRVTLRASLSYGKLQSDDFVVADPSGDNSKFRYIRNTQFKNSIVDLSVVGIVDLKKNSATYLNRAPFTPYALIGFSVFHHNPKGLVPEMDYTKGGGSAPTAFSNAGEWVALEPLGTEGQYATLEPTDANYGIKPYSLWQISIPFGIGMRYKLSDAIDFSFDFSVRWLFTDYIDDVSSNYVDLDVLDSDLARAMSYRSNEPTSVATGEPRDISGWEKREYVGRNGGTYDVITGFGEEYTENKRGGSKYNDIYYVSSIRIVYILGASFRTAKFR